MGKILVLAEKPSVARDIAGVLKCSQKGPGCLTGSKYIITWALGHLVTLADPEAYDDRYKHWRLEDLPMLPEKMKLIVIKQTAKQFGFVKKLMQRSDVDELVIATDAGREGELVARWIIQKAGFKKPIQRLWISSQTDKSIREGFEHLKPGNLYDNLYLSALCRSKADWLIGLNVTRALTCKYNAQLSAGRVQTPTLAMIVNREKEIRNFKPKNYWTIQSTLNGFTLQWRNKTNGQVRIFDKSYAEKIISKVSGQSAEVIDVLREAKRELSPLAYDLTELQRDANRRYGYSAKQTLNLMQRLYETHKLVTYPRTDSRYITDDIVPTLPERLKSISVGPYAQVAKKILKNKINVTKRFVNNSKVSDHHAIIPTDQYVDLSSLNREEKHIYDLIVKRFLAVLSPAFEYEQTTIKVDCKGEIFTAKGRTEKKMGWREIDTGAFDVDEDESEKEQSLPDVKKGIKGGFEQIRLTCGKTKPPARYTEATLLSAMEHPGKFVEDKILRNALESSSGLGTPATRADIIEKLFNTFYIERKGKEIYPTSKGIQLINLVPEDLKSPKLTGQWEQQLTYISKGKANPHAFIHEMREYATKLVQNVTTSSETFKHDNVTREKCKCGQYLLEVNGKRGKMLVCPDRECGFRKTIARVSNARCPECHKKMEIRGEGDKQSFYCVCGYREKLENFKKRKSTQVNKKEVKRFMRQQETGENINSSLADALSKWKENQ